MNIKVSELFITMDDNIKNAVATIERSGNLGLALVVDENLRLVNTITDGDIRRGILAGFGLEDAVGRLLEVKKDTDHPVPVTALLGTPSHSLRDLLEREKIRQIPLVDCDGRIHDIVISSELLQKSIATDVDVLIMAGGRGTRLSPLTDSIPKPLLPLNGIPMLKMLIDQLVMSGFVNIYISVHYLAEKIKNYFFDGKAHGASIKYLQENRPLGTGGALALMPSPRKTTVVINGDVLTTVNLNMMIEFHRENNAAITMAVVNHTTTIPFGVVECDGQKITKLIEKPEIRNLVNAGIYVVEPHVFDHVPFGCKMDATDLVTNLLETEEVVSFPILEFWSDVGDHATYQRIQSEIRGLNLSTTAIFNSSLNHT